MIQCPFCKFANEDGSLFCEKCKSDLGAAVAAVVVNEPHEGQQVEAFALKSDGSEAPVSAIPLDAGSVAGPVAVAEPLTGGNNPFDHTAALEPVKTGKSPSAAAAEANPMAFGPTAPLPSSSSPIVKPPAPEAMLKKPIEPTPAPANESPRPSATTAPAASDGDFKLAPDAKPHLTVIRGQRVGAEYPIYEGENFIGRTDEKPVDIDLEDQEPPDRIWSSRQHAVITLEDHQLFIEDLSSMNGTFVNRARVHPGQRRSLKVNDIVQIGTVQMKLKV